MVEHAGQAVVRLPETTHHKLGGKVVAAGQQAREALAGLFGFASNPGVAVTAAAWTDHSVEIAVAEGEQVHVFHVERRGPESRGLVLTKHLSVYSRGKDLPLSLAELVQKAAVSNLPDWTMDHLAVLITSDPRSGKPGLPTPPARDEANRPRSCSTRGEPTTATRTSSRAARSPAASSIPSTLRSCFTSCSTVTRSACT